MTETCDLRHRAAPPARRIVMRKARRMKSFSLHGGANAQRQWRAVFVMRTLHAAIEVEHYAPRL